VGPDVVTLLGERGIQPSAQRVAVAQYVLFTEEHPSADRVWTRVRSRFPMISRATVYNTLNLFVARGLVREVHLSPSSVVFDGNTDAHHHLIDEETGRIYDIPWQKVAMRRLPAVEGFEIQGYEVVMRGRKTPARKQSPTPRGAVRRRRDQDRKAGVSSGGRRQLRRGAAMPSRGTGPRRKSF
jgi:Fur family iron response transcriptional regulator